MAPSPSLQVVHVLKRGEEGERNEVEKTDQMAVGLEEGR